MPAEGAILMSVTDAQRLACLWEEADRVVVLTGAGISTDSGIPDFRGPQGLWTQNPAAQAMFDIDTYLRDAEVRKQAWRNRREHPAWTAHPNAGHRALAELEAGQRLDAVLTQNIDGLHQAAGSRYVLELHGTLWQAVCLSCGHLFDMQDTLSRDEEDPACLDCGGILKSATVSFGQRLDERVLSEAIDAVRTSDLLVTVGTTLQVNPVAGLAGMARRLAVINGAPTAYDEQADVVIRGSISPTLTEVAVRLAR